MNVIELGFKYVLDGTKHYYRTHFRVDQNVLTMLDQELMYQAWQGLTRANLVIAQTAHLIINLTTGEVMKDRDGCQTNGTVGQEFAMMKQAPLTAYEEVLLAVRQMEIMKTKRVEV